MIFSICSAVIVLLIKQILNSIMYRNLVFDDISYKEKNLNELLFQYFDIQKAKAYKVKLKRGFIIIKSLNLISKRFFQKSKPKLPIDENTNTNIKVRFNYPNIKKNFLGKNEF